MPEPIIQVQGLYKSYGEVQALRGIDFAVEEGEVFGLLGPNGAGKTTTVEILEGMRTPDRGLARVCGLDPEKSGSQFKEMIGAVLQSTSLPDKLRVKEAIELFAQFYRNRANTDDLLKRFQLEEKRNAFYSQLSGGQKQRLCIARAIFHQAPILILDEATSQVDAESEQLIQRAIDGLLHERTTFVIAHRFSTIKSADSIVVMDRGKIVGQGSHEELLRTCETYVQLYEGQLLK